MRSNSRGPTSHEPLQKFASNVVGDIIQVQPILAKSTRQFCKWHSLGGNVTPMSLFSDDVLSANPLLFPSALNELVERFLRFDSGDIDFTTSSDSTTFKLSGNNFSIGRFLSTRLVLRMSAATFL